MVRAFEAGLAARAVLPAALLTNTDLGFGLVFGLDLGRDFPRVVWSVLIFRARDLAMGHNYEFRDGLSHYSMRVPAKP